MDIHWRTNAINNSRVQLFLHVLADILLKRTATEPARNEVILDFVSVSSRDIAGKVGVVSNLVSVDIGRISLNQTERTIKSGVLDFRGANFANHMPYFSKPKQKDLMCKEDTWNVKEKYGRSDFWIFYFKQGEKP